MDQPFAYDSVAYPSMVFPLIRPGRVAAVAEMHGVAVENIETCRVLELGCGDGMTLLSAAHSMPDAEFLGVDLSAPRIREAEQFTEELELRNIRFRQADVYELDPESLGRFDFIFAHGFLSWVPDGVRTKALELYGHCLNTGGVGLISYNAYPGYHLRSILREAMLYSVKDMDHPELITAERLKFANFLSQAISDQNEYGRLVRHEQASLAKKPSNLIFHDDIAEFNQPFYFHEFATLIEREGLQFVAELDPSVSSARDLTPMGRAAADEFWDRPIEREQLIDFLRGTRFRNSLVCGSGAHVSYRVLPGAVRRLFLGTNARPVDEPGSLVDESETAFTLPNGKRFSTSHPLAKTALVKLGQSWPERLVFDELESELRNNFGGFAHYHEKLERLTELLAELIAGEIVEASRFRPRIAAAISERPKVSDFARWQANRRCEYVTNPSGASVRLENDLMRAVIVSMNGATARKDLAAAVPELIRFPDSDLDQVRKSLPEMIEKFLPSIRDAGLLVD